VVTRSINSRPFTGREFYFFIIGSGTGLATIGFVDLGFDNVTCIELGQNLAELTREKFKNKPNVNIINSSFETWQGEKRNFDLAISGTAFHLFSHKKLAIARSSTCLATKAL
jgi:ubiquinone/menaquinone biosynthesis C-methylase UbiE